MKRIFSVLIFLFVISLFFTCASSPAPAVSEAGGSSVWKASRNGNTILLGGSIHLLRDADFPLPGEFDLAFSQSEFLVLETDIERMEDEDMANYLLRQTVYTDGRTLQTVLNPEVYQMLAAKSGEFGLPIEVISVFKPSMVMSMLSVLQIQQMGFTQMGIDYYYLNQANTGGKPLKYLESVESQIDMIATIGEGYENDYVLYNLQDMDATEEYILAMVDDWKNGASVTGEHSIKEMIDEWPLLYSAMLTDRHDAWMPQIEEYLDSGSVHFIIVGLLHMHGPDGLLQRLRNMGCTVEKLR